MNILIKLSKDIIFWILVFLLLISHIFTLNIIKVTSIGALVGYITNVLAIWMLFNPKKKFFGFQGVIPKKRDEIALNTSKIIENEFINAKSIRQFIENNKEIFAEMLFDFVEKQGNKVIPPISKIFQNKTAEVAEKMAEKLKLDNKDSLWENLKNKSISAFCSPEMLINFILKILENEEFVNFTKHQVAKQVKIPLLPVDSIIANIVDKFLNNITYTLKLKGDEYHKLIEYLKEKCDTLKVKDIIEKDDFFHLVDFLNTKSKDFFKSIILNLFNQEINVKYILNILNVKEIITHLIDRYEKNIIDIAEKLLQKISFKDIVREKIESYSIEEMEKVTLELAKRELRYVEIFGIPLGILISIFQIIF
ncbi:hypothetical protein SU69_04200 [Thermosipho melanesiensis]|uniref:Uncharacterized protein-like protein n=2 Tax=Thermosipho melanesiensis TaxID=46541 RepID=A6LL83_THEM4|nr:DUF445 family protein [Thermosipho melanesiensis]ABR30684.1 Uncharacterized protein-like protein [Thermosipho melanesiensis BI429]APT74856.1 hypothetical protein BW47_04430 [Thermosipho melanesiensis]OOC35753.1 hypothetical protein SU68_04255 [Thermosipho melanesiensis]OOC39052.1 hypothetical protein SU69_04200 [Thermosipho melanesiensis]OOC39200.1 hypothetical protein SU70_04200 [Thermosipho melanesiensis]